MMITVKRKLRLFLYQCTCMQWSCWYSWRGWCKPAIAAFYFVLVMVSLPLLVYQFAVYENHTEMALFFVAGFFVLLTLPIFLVGLMQHIFNYTQPHLQKHIIRIVWIVPIYSLNGFLAFRYQAAAIYLDTIRECYEAYVLYNFLCYLCNFLTSEYDLVAELESRPPISQTVPCCCLPPWPKGAVFLRRCRIGVLQYVVVRVVVTVIALITQLCGKYHKGLLKPDNAWVYLSLMNGISQAGALYSLVYFYRGTRQLLKPIHPVGKFLSIKLIIFAVFWQNLLVSVLVMSKVVPKEWHERDLQEGIQNFLLVVEMLFFAIAHYFVFSHKPFIDPAAAEVPCIATCCRMLDVRDVAGDVKEHFVDPIPRPRFRSGGRGTIGVAGGVSGEGEGSEVGSSEEAPLLRKGTPPPARVSGRPRHDDEGSGYGSEPLGGMVRPLLEASKGGVTDLSFDVLSLGDLDNRRDGYGRRAELIAAACRKEEEEEEEGGSSSQHSSRGDSPLSSNSSH